MFFLNVFYNILKSLFLIVPCYTFAEKRMTDLDEIKKLSIVDFLAKSGLKPRRSSGKWVFFFSPFREESKPSFAVNTVKNTWYDFGTEDYGSIIDLAMKLNGSSFKETIKFFKNPFMIIEENVKPVITKPGIEIIDFKELLSDKHIEYLISRKVNPQIARLYCHEVSFRFPYGKSQRTYSCIGFKNDLGGYELRNSFFKVSSAPKCYTTIPGENVRVNLFEGFMDYLSALTYYKKKKFKNKTYVLNGVGQIGSLLPMLEGKIVNVFLDNDAAGDAVVEKLKTAGVEYEDFRDIYEWYNDFNAFIMAQ